MIYIFVGIKVIGCEYFMIIREFVFLRMMVIVVDDFMNLFMGLLKVFLCYFLWIGIFFEKFI